MYEQISERVSAMQKRTHTFQNINRFSMDISYLDIHASAPINAHSHHIHDACEIYVNLSGDVSFAVENSFYPIMPGNIIITRPYEYHHCIYHSDKRHKHFWILFNPAGNEEMFDIFFKRDTGKNNLLIPNPKSTEELVQICEKLNSGTESEVEKYFCFFQLLNILNNADSFNAPNNSGNESVISAINFINENLSSSISVKEIANYCNVSLSTLERHFFRIFNISPSEYIKKRRLASSVELLHRGYSITNVASLCGFSDCSGFIATFKKEYNITPLQYRKHLSQKMSD